MRLRFILTLLAVTSSAVAAPIRMDPAEAMRRASAAAPAVRPRRIAVTGAREVVRSAEQVLPTPPRLELAVGPRFLDEDDRTGIDATLGLAQEFSLGGLQRARRQWAVAVGAEATARLEVAVRDARTHAGLAWVEARLARELRRIRASSLRDAEEIARVAASRVRAGSVLPAEAAVAQALVGRARADLIEAEGRLFVADTDLRHLTGIGNADLEVVGALDLPDEPRLVLAQRARMRPDQPDVRVAERAAFRSKRAVELARANAAQTLAVGPSVTREATGDWILLARASFPLPLLDPGAFETARARSDAEVLHAEARLVRARLEREIDLGVEERKHARELRDALRRGVIGPAREALRQALAQYRAGSVDISSLLAVRRELLAAEERWADACAVVLRADIRLMRLVGTDAPAAGIGVKR